MKEKQREREESMLIKFCLLLNEKKQKIKQLQDGFDDEQSSEEEQKVDVTAARVRAKQKIQKQVIESLPSLGVGPSDNVSMIDN